MSGEVKKSNRLDPPDPDSICKALGISTLTIDWLAGDGSDRCYYRIKAPEHKKNYVLMQLSGFDAEALKKGGYDWVKIAEVFASRHIRAPKPVALMPDHAALIIDDYGDMMLETFVLACHKSHDDRALETIYDQCFEVLGKFLTLKASPTEVWCQRAFDTERFVWELNFFDKKFLQPVLYFNLDDAQKKFFEKDIKALANYLSVDSKYFVHRDFHSRNVMIDDSNIAVIDFQDARLGPCSYDLVSLCFDSYVPFSKSDRQELLKNGVAVMAVICGQEIGKKILEQWKPMLLQRQLKAIGSFGYLTVDKNKGDYLKYVDAALQTLEQQDVTDDRWPFLSGELLKIMRKEWNKKYAI